MIPRALVILLLMATIAAADDDRMVVTMAGDRRVTLTLRGNEPVLLLRFDGVLAEDAVRGALVDLLASVFPDGTMPVEVRSVSVGRIEQLPWLAERLALAAAHAPAWNATAGTARGGADNAVVAALLMPSVAQGALADPFARYDRVVRSASVEKVLVQRAGDLPFAPALRAAGVRDDARLPFDAQLWLRLGPR